MTPSAFRNRLASRIRFLQAVTDGLDGKPFDWIAAEGSPAVRILRDEFGIEIVTATAAKRHGHRIKQGAEPVGQIYFTAPISASHPVYVLGVQTVPKTAS